MTRTQRAAVIGHPIGHTMSPFLQERLFALQNIPMEYRVMDLPDLKEGLPALRQIDCFNITIPYKNAILPFLEEADEKARACGSVNTVKVRDGKFYGTTTDGAGCFQSLQSHGLDFSGEVLLLGSGGAARAIAFEIAARQPRYHLTIACRDASYAKTCALADELAAFSRQRGNRGFLLVVEKYSELDIAAELPGDKPLFDLLLNATSVGMFPNAGASPVPEKVISRCSAVFDAVYNPGETELLRMAGACGAKTVGGMEMLVYQAVAAHEFWYGHHFRKEDLYQVIRDAGEELEKRFGKREER